MSKLVLRAFGGMMPVRDSRLLPDASAEEAINTWFYSGSIEGIKKPRAIHTLANPYARSVFRVPIGSPRAESIENSKWLEFEGVNATVVRSPVTDVDDARYYIADGVNPPRYTTYSRIMADQPTLLLGVPAPAAPPFVVATGGWQLFQSVRSYTYTWVTKYQEEGPPAPPSAPVTGRIDAEWEVTLTPPVPSDTNERELAYVNIYRTVTSAQNISVFYFVAQVPTGTTRYVDRKSDVEILNSSPLPSTFWTAPPNKLGGLTALPNGMIAGFVGQEIWYCEPFRPHAWPAPYQTSVDYNIVGMAALEQMLVVGTENVAYIAAGVHPSAVSLRMVTGSEPCAGQGSFAVVPQGVLYASRHGLMLTNTGGSVNVVKQFVDPDKWATLVNLNLMHAAILNGGYYTFSGVYEGAFQWGAFQADAFQTEHPIPEPLNHPSTSEGIFVDYNDPRIAFTRLRHETVTYNVLTDVWTAEILLIRNGKVWLLELPAGTSESYDWLSKLFQLPKPENMAAMKVVYEPVEGPNFGSVEVYAGGKLRLSRALPPSGKVFRLPSGFKSDKWQVRYAGTVDISQVEVATSVKELSEV